LRGKIRLKANILRIWLASELIEAVILLAGWAGWEVLS
jgi:hypothetical protein